MIDTICAISTPAGVGGMAVARLSGPKAKEIALRLMPACADLVPRHATLASLRKVASQGHGELIDEGVVTFFQAPASYTGEDVVEIACHGSQYVQQILIECLIGLGARIAKPGEFTRRAFMNGRLNLSQAEAVADLIDSVNAVGHQLAISQLRGGYSQGLSALRTQLLDLTSLLELELDFSEEDVEFANRRQLTDIVDTILAKVNSLCEGFRMGNAIKGGVPVAIVGRPNVGKSTLLNALLKEDRAIVSNRPGTTRDVIEDTLTLQGICFRIIDTAGLRHSGDAVEQEGMARSIQAARRAQIVLYVVDAKQSTEQITQELDALGGQVPLDGKILLLVCNKADTLCADAICPDGKETSHNQCQECGSLPYANEGSPLSPKDEFPPTFQVSAKYGNGIALVEQALVDTVRRQLPQDGVLVTNARHYEALTHIRTALSQVKEGLHNRLPADLVSIDLRDALHYLGEITGEVTTEEVLGNIFSRFCVGK